MVRTQQPGLMLFAVGMMGLGILALVYGDFAMVWQPVAAWVPGRTGLAYASGVLMLLCGAGLLFSATREVVGSNPVSLSHRVDVAEGACSGGCASDRGRLAGYRRACHASGWRVDSVCGVCGVAGRVDSEIRGGEKGIRIARILFAVAVLPVGLSHLFYVKETVAVDSGVASF